MNRVLNPIATEQGYGAAVRALASHQCGLGSIPGIRVLCGLMWVEFVVGSRFCPERFFSGYSGFPLSSKTYISKFQFDLESEGPRFVGRNRLLKCHPL